MVRSGETLFIIAQRYGVTVSQIQKWNNIENPDMIDKGQRLVIFPSAQNAPSSPSRVVDSPKTGKKISKVKKKPPVFKYFPVENGVMLRGFAPKATPPREGIVIAAPKGARVLAVSDGSVLHAAEVDDALGFVIIVQHKDSQMISVYTGVDGTLVKKGQSVKAGRTIAFIGSSKETSTPRMEFQLREGRVPLNPWPWLVGQ